VHFSQIKLIVDDTTVRPPLTEEQIAEGFQDPEPAEGEEVLPRFDEEKHMYIQNAKIMKSDAEVGQEMIFPLDAPDAEFGRIAAQTAKQVIMQRLREAEKGTIAKEYIDKQGTIVSGVIQTIERGNIFVEFYRATGILHITEQIPEEVGPGEAVFASMASQLSKYGEKAPEGKKENNSLDFVEYTKEDHEAIAQEYTDSIIKSNANPEDYAAELARKVEKSRTLAAEQNSDLTKIGGESEEIRKFKEDVARYNAKEGDIIRPFEQLTEKTIEEKKALTEKFLTLTKESAPKVEETQEALKNKQEQSIKKLEGMGLTRVGKALEAFKNMSSKKKLALGIALAGLSVATGGATSFVSTGLSALTFGLRDYDKEKAKAAERGVETDKMTMLKSAVTGLVLALGTSALFHIAGDAVGAASEKLSPMIENLKHFFSPETVAAADSLSPGEVIVPVGPDVVPHSPVSTVTPDIATAPQTVTESAFSHTPDTTAPVEVVTQSAVEVPQSAPITDQYLGKIEVPPYVPSAINFGDMDYTIKAGDTYSNIMDRILPHVRGVELLDPTSKAELLKNFHEQYSSTGTFSGLSSYPDMISNIDGAKVGTEIRVDQLRGALEEEVKRRFPGNFSN
jgi:hypothetical protein